MIAIHLDVAVSPAKEQEMLRYFESVFRPAAMKFEGYIDVRMLKLRAAVMGTAPAGVNYRFALTYQSEELRQKWVTSDIHATVWAGMEKTFSSAAYDVLLFDAV
jgi:heme-degrading monooxygenase HmoA